MPILTLQRRLREVGRIRMGEQVPAGNGRKRPAKLAHFRLTARDADIIDAVANVYGGEPKKWDAPDGVQSEVIITTDAIPVVVPPGDMAHSEWMELWSAGGCQRRCDGVTEYIADQPCVCDPDDRECNITSRLSVMLPEVPGFGLWRLETHGYYAATELGGVVEMCRRASAAGHMLPARLRLEQRQVKRVVKGKPQTFKFAVPVLDLDVQLSTLGQLSGSGPSLTALADPEAPALSSAWSPVGELPEGPSVSVADQVAAVDEPKPAKPRKNAAQPIPKTGLKPRKAAEVGGPRLMAGPGEGFSAQRAKFEERRAAAESDPVVTPEVVPDGDGPRLSPDRALAARARELGIDDRTRHGVYIAVTAGRATSGKDLAVPEVSAVFDLFNDWENVEVWCDQGTDWTVLWGDETYYGIDVAAVGGDPVASPPADDGGPDLPSSVGDWSSLMKERGVKLGAVIKFAQTLPFGESEPPSNLHGLCEADEAVQRQVFDFIQAGGQS